MNLAIVVRDVTIGTRTRAFAAALAAHTALLAAFIMLWEGGVPMLPGGNVYEQQRLVQGVFLVCLLPWAAVRCAPSDRGDGLVLLSALAADRPSSVVAAQFAARAVLLVAIVISALPVMLLARDLAALPLSRVMADLLPPLAIAAVAASASVWWTLALPDRIVAWLGTTATTLIAVALGGLLRSPAGTAAALLIISMIGVTASATRANASLRYLSEPAA